MSEHTLSRSLHDLGLAAWFGGTLANATALNAAAAEADSPSKVGAVANVGWDRWTPVNAAAIGAHVLGSIGMLSTDLGRVSTQRGVARTVALKTGLTVAALGATAYSRSLGQRVSQQTEVPAASGTEPAAGTPKQVANAQRQLTVLQWVIPALTGALVVVSSHAGEQQRPENVLEGLLARARG
ncbi:MAG: ABC-type Mn/Zn transport systems, ATPase component [uncultured Nocardioides sp.]|uniref:ABC-type Mn/Zn transport systems, ATPase component n=1 Tax=uncultured Nocardioides sp. TaxID=198441 RepID=A0A6J4NAV8_9ACTN|nr:MAG: ABC-type Mn/Zn transport systems, ATPase component [uncultured Nocardioides sp.]